MTEYEALTSRLKEVKVKIDSDGVALVTLDRPVGRNAWTLYTQDELIKVYTALEEDERVKVIVYTGGDNKNNIFCAGADLSMGDFSSESSGTKLTEREHRDGGGRFVTFVHNRVRKVTIAAINGHASGVGITQTLSMDIRLAWRDAKIVFPFVRRGIVPEATSSYLLPKLIGNSRALQIFLTGNVFKASDSIYNGLFFYEQPEKREDVLPRALALAREIATQTSAVSCYFAKSLVWHPADSIEGQHLLDSRAMFVLGDGKDSREGVKSFMEKRAPKFAATVNRDLPDWVPWWNHVDLSVPNKSKL
ncbi:enoyl-CoA hydratase/isomerase [Planoprotostelium fungivorum]|uniref:Enoyl-CoA hydratase/isomerase n=1 Tax=Planoprotostelium fungivorum TaxID=1890364 RepID=A0A2P6NCL5_9EUKA|nr:enoyl-CoA hydratase/isomerase [Planoprotostelium fungivorum]